MATTRPKSEPAPAAGRAGQAPAAPAKPKKSRAKIVVLGALTLVLAGGGAGAWHFLRAPTHASTASKTAPPRPVTYMSLDPFTVNLQSADAERYLQVGLALKLADPAYEDAIKARMPEIRNRVLLLLSGKRAADIATVEGKRKLSQEILAQIAQAIAGHVPAQGVRDVLFTSFVIQ